MSFGGEEPSLISSSTADVFAENALLGSVGAERHDQGVRHRAPCPPSTLLCSLEPKMAQSRRASMGMALKGDLHNKISIMDNFILFADGERWAGVVVRPE